MTVATDFLEWLSKNGGKGLMRDPKTGRILPRPSAASGADEGPNFGGQYSVKGGEGMVRPSDLAEGANYGGNYSVRGETLAGQGAPSTAVVPVKPPVAADPNFTMVKPPSTAIAPRSSTDVARFLEEANAAKAASGAAASRWGLPVAAGAAGIGAAGLYDDFGRPVGPAQSETPDRYAGWVSPENRPESQGWREPLVAPASHPAVQAATAAVRNVPTPPPLPVEVAPRAPIDWGNADSPSDFFRADRELQARKAAGEDFGFARGGMPTAHEHALHKALHIIHHLLSRGGRA